MLLNELLGHAGKELKNVTLECEDPQIAFELAQHEMEHLFNFELDGERIYSFKDINSTESIDFQSKDDLLELFGSEEF